MNQLVLAPRRANSSSRSFLGVAVAVLLFGSGCAVTSHESRPTKLGRTSSLGELEALIDQPGPVSVETVVAADWSVDRGGLVNLEHEKAKRAHLEDDEVPIQIYFYAVRHPQRGLYFVDSGVDETLLTRPEDSKASWILRQGMGLDRLKARTPPAAYLRAHPEKLEGIFLTHMHGDHVLGIADVPNSVPIYVGPGEPGQSQFINVFVQGTVDRILEEHPPLEVFPGEADAVQGGVRAVIDVFSDGSFWALHVPGHTQGSLAFIARTPSGPVLLAGDTCHTEWGWEQEVEPGSFTADHSANAQSLHELKALAARHSMEVHLGHQPIHPRAESEPRSGAAITAAK